MLINAVFNFILNRLPRLGQILQLCRFERTNAVTTYYMKENKYHNHGKIHNNICEIMVTNYTDLLIKYLQSEHCVQQP